MLSRNQAKYINSLKLSRFRDEHGEFVAEGIKVVDELLGSDWEISKIFALHSWIDTNLEILRKKNLDCQEVSEQELKQISQLSTPNQVLATVIRPSREIEPGTDLSGLTLMLDHIQDPGNLGTIIRTADWFGIRQIICSHHTADLYNPKVIQSTMGSFIRVKVGYTDLRPYLEKLPEQIKVYGSMAGGENIYKAEINKDAILIIGNESRGISPGLIPYISKKIGIPGSASGAESLNASIATAIICSEFARRFGPW
jgi:RNA methyltransferase, TrmH family